MRRECTGFSKKSSDDPVRLVPLAIYFCTSHGPAGQTFHKHKATPPLVCLSDENLFWANNLFKFPLSRKAFFIK